LRTVERREIAEAEPAAGAISLRQAYECWKAGADPIEWAKTHKEFARAFESFPGWRNKLGIKAA
jgi:ribulose-bisphosphate carboxylase large chain